jgi:hypothetical protein
MSSELTRILARIIDGQRPKGTNQSGRALQSIQSFKDDAAVTDDFGNVESTFTTLSAMTFSSLGTYRFDQIYFVNPYLLALTPSATAAQFGAARFALNVFSA